MAQSNLSASGRLLAIDPALQLEPWGNVTPPAPTQLAAPTGLAATATNSSTIGTSWNSVANAALYRLRRNGVVVYEGNNLSHTHTGLQPSTAYTFDVMAVGNGTTYLDSAYSPAVSRATPAPSVALPATWLRLNTAAGSGTTYTQPAAGSTAVTAVLPTSGPSFTTVGSMALQQDATLGMPVLVDTGNVGWLETESGASVPEALYGNGSRTFAMVVQHAGDTTRELMGYGGNANSQAFDLAVSTVANNKTGVHRVGTDYEAAVPRRPGVWQLLIASYDATTSTLTISNGTQTASEIIGPLITGSDTANRSKFRIGLGAFGQWFEGDFRFAYARVLTGSCDAQQEPALRQEILSELPASAAAQLS